MIFSFIIRSRIVSVSISFVEGLLNRKTNEKKPIDKKEYGPISITKIDQYKRGENCIKNVYGTDKKKFNFFCFTEILFSCDQVNLNGSYEGDPLSPPKREATCGEQPLDPPPSGYFHQPVWRGYRILGDALAAGAEARCAGAPRSDY